MMTALAEIMISQKLKETIRLKGISVATLARAVNRSVDTVKNHIYRDKTPSAEDFLLYCKALGLSVDDFADCIDFSSISPIQKTAKPKKRIPKKLE